MYTDDATFEEDRWKICHLDYDRPFESLEDVVGMLLPFHVGILMRTSSWFDAKSTLRALARSSPVQSHTVAVLLYHCRALQSV